MGCSGSQDVVRMKQFVYMLLLVLVPFTSTIVLRQQSWRRPQNASCRSNGGNTEGCLMAGGIRAAGTIGAYRKKVAQLTKFIKDKGDSNVKLIIRNKFDN